MPTENKIISIRMPYILYERLMAEAAAQHRTLTGEVLLRLEQTFKKEPK